MKSALLYNQNMLKNIPITTAPFFQEYTFSTLDADVHAALVIERILAYGDRDEVHWLFEYYGKPRLRDWIQKDGLRLLPKRRYHLWCILLGIDPETPTPKNAWNH
jgi:hypothetical protein